MNEQLGCSNLRYIKLIKYPCSQSISYIAIDNDTETLLIIMKALKCKTLCAELAHAYALHYNLNICAFYPDDRLPYLNAQRQWSSLYLPASMIENGRLGRAKVKNEL